MVAKRDISGPVAVLGADSPIGLTVIRELGEHGVPVIALVKDAKGLGRYSRHATGFEVIETPLAGFLPRIAEKHGLSAVMAISEHHLIELAQMKGALGACKVLCPDPDKLATVLHKQRTYEIAAGVGIDRPSTWQPVLGEDFARIAGEIAYPVAIKWPDPNLVGAKLAAHDLPLEKVEYAADAGELLAILDRYRPLGEWPIVQTWCPGHGLGQMLHMQDGQATLTFQHKRLREWPPTGGVSAFCEAVDPAEHREQMARSESLLRAIGWEGPAMVEYRFDPATGRYWLMEVNGRFWGSIPLAYHCGAHFAWEQYRQSVLGEGGARQDAYRLRKARYAIPDAKHLVAVLRDGERGIGERLGIAARFAVDFLDPRVRYYVWSLSDPKPFLGDLAGIAHRRRQR
jgi:predicted ATP-grasp superfamily ATP-dependent carboligase